MEAAELLEALKKLPPAERLMVIEAALRLTREEMQPEGPKTALEEKQQQAALARKRLLHSLDEPEENLLRKLFRVFTG